jgi:hypothetical protein
MKPAMLRLWTDFNSGTDADEFFILRHDGPERRLPDPASVNVGQRILLFQDEDDFEVEAELCLGYLDAVRDVSWYAVPDRTTIRRFEGSQGQDPSPAAGRKGPPS